VGNYINKTNVSSKQWAKTIEKYPTRFLFGSDSVAPKKQSEYISVFSGYRKLWRKLSKESMRMVTIENYTRLFDAANKNVRKWESEHSVRIE